MGIINELDLHVANLIAAGEVVERPASCVKELVENALDAGATEITVEIKRGGVQFLRVTDNGCGIAREDLPIALKRHATSKIRNENDLDGIMTLGFRGEALAAIASVSNLKIMTKRTEDESGSVLISECGRVVSVSDAGCRNGTTVIVENLFENVPARRKFLKKDSSEAMAVISLCEKLALSRPDVSFRMISDNVQKFITAGDKKLLNAIRAVLGREFSQRLFEVNSLTLGIEVIGYIGRPEAMKASRNLQIYFINGRYFKSRSITAAIEQAFDSYSEAGKFPTCVLMINIHPALVDVNVHPTKLEVKFSNERAVFDAVFCAVKNTLIATNNNSEYFETGNMKESDRSYYNAFVPIEDRNSGEADIEKSVANAPEPIHSAADESFISLFSPSAYNSDISVGASDHQMPSAQSPNSVKERENVPTPLYKEENKSTYTPFFDSDLLFASKEKDEVSINADDKDDKKESEHTASVRNDDVFALDSSDKEINTEKSTGGFYIGKTAVLERASETIPEYRIIGVAFNAYIFVELDKKTLVIDKHAAHERIIFESMKLMAKRRESAMQMLLIPSEIKLSREEMSTLVQWQDEVRDCGFGFSFDEEECLLVLTEIPSFMTLKRAEDMIQTVIADLSAYGTAANITKERFFEESLYQASCKSAMKAGIPDDDIHIKWLVESMLSLPDIRYCPHGRPVAFEMTKNDIEKFFKRT